MSSYSGQTFAYSDSYSEISTEFRGFVRVETFDYFLLEDFPETYSLTLVKNTQGAETIELMNENLKSLNYYSQTSMPFNNYTKSTRHLFNLYNECLLVYGDYETRSNRFDSIKDIVLIVRRERETIEVNKNELNTINLKTDHVVGISFIQNEESIRDYEQGVTTIYYDGVSLYYKYFPKDKSEFKSNYYYFSQGEEIYASRFLSQIESFSYDFGLNPFPRDTKDLLLISFEEYKKNNNDSYKKICESYGLDEYVSLESEKSNEVIATSDYFFFRTNSENLESFIGEIKNYTYAHTWGDNSATIRSIGAYSKEISINDTDEKWSINHISYPDIGVDIDEYIILKFLGNRLKEFQDILNSNELYFTEYGYTLNDKEKIDYLKEKKSELKNTEENMNGLSNINERLNRYHKNSDYDILLSQQYETNSKVIGDLETKIGDIDKRIDYELSGLRSDVNNLTNLWGLFFTIFFGITGLVALIHSIFIPEKYKKQKNRKITILNRQKILPGNLTNTNIGVFIFLFVVGVLLYFFIFHIYF